MNFTTVDSMDQLLQSLGESCGFRSSTHVSLRNRFYLQGVLKEELGGTVQIFDVLDISK